MTLEERIQRLEDRAAIGELLANYCFFIDDRDMENVATLFTPDGCFRSVDGVMNALGREAVMDNFINRFAALGPSNHFTHDRALQFDANDPDLAHGRVNAHAEVVRNGQAMLTSLRYRDTYQRSGGVWRFKDRLLSFLYYMPIADYPVAMLGEMRMRAYGDERPADFPESFATYQRYHREA